MVKQETPKIFGQRRPNLVKIYEMLKASETPLPRTRLFQTANVQAGPSTALFLWLVEQGFIRKVDFRDLGIRRPSRSIKGIFRITAQGREVIKVYEALLDILSLSEQARLRFPREAEAVKTKPFSGQKVIV